MQHWTAMLDLLPELAIEHLLLPKHADHGVCTVKDKI